MRVAARRRPRRRATPGRQEWRGRAITARDGGDCVPSNQKYLMDELEPQRCSENGVDNRLDCRPCSEPGVGKQDGINKCGAEVLRDGAGRRF